MGKIPLKFPWSSFHSKDGPFFNRFSSNPCHHEHELKWSCQLINIQNERALFCFQRKDFATEGHFALKEPGRTRCAAPHSAASAETRSCQRALRAHRHLFIGLNNWTWCSTLILQSRDKEEDEGPIIASHGMKGTWLIRAFLFLIKETEQTTCKGRGASYSYLKDRDDETWAKTSAENKSRRRQRASRSVEIK